AGVTDTAAGSVTNGVTNTVTAAVTENAIVPAPTRKVARSATSASRIVKRAMSEPPESAAPIVAELRSPGPTRVTPPPVLDVPPRESGWHCFGRIIIGLALILLAAATVITSLRGGVWAGYALSVDANAGEIFSTLLVVAELFAAILPTAARLYSRMGEGWS